ncbi:MAG: hypothetical protein Q4F95_13435 [Oscillospiraceae bacterium]|nr:hypothetical protein [Oscillospiraceae bacterium]
MKKVLHKVLSYMTFSAVAFAAFSPLKVSAATKDDVISATMGTNLPKETIQQGINYLNTKEFTSEQYDQMLAEIQKYTQDQDKNIQDELENKNPPAEDSSSSAGQDSTAEQGGTTDSSSAGSGDSSQSSDSIVSEKVDDFMNMTQAEKEEYINNLTPQQKNEIIKNMDKDKQMEIVNGIISVGEQFGMHITVDDFQDNTLTYSVRDSEGKVVDISSVGVIVDDTGLDYSKLILGSAAVILLSCGAVAAFAYVMGHRKENFGGSENDQ